MNMAYPVQSKILNDDDMKLYHIKFLTNEEYEKIGTHTMGTILCLSHDFMENYSLVNDNYNAILGAHNHNDNSSLCRFLKGKLHCEAIAVYGGYRVGVTDDLHTSWRYSWELDVNVI